MIETYNADSVMKMRQSDKCCQAVQKRHLHLVTGRNWQRYSHSQSDGVEQPIDELTANIAHLGND